MRAVGPFLSQTHPGRASVTVQATYTKESTERMLLMAYAWKATPPLVAAFALVESYPYLCNVPAVLAALAERLEMLP